MDERVGRWELLEFICPVCYSILECKYQEGRANNLFVLIWFECKMCDYKTQQIEVISGKRLGGYIILAKLNNLKDRVLQ
jgi:C4-type Zn-finger protein